MADTILTGADAGKDDKKKKLIKAGLIILIVGLIILVIYKMRK